MEQTALEAVQTLGLPSVLVLYWLYKDWKFTAQMQQLMGRVTLLLEKLEGSNDAR